MKKYIAIGHWNDNKNITSVASTSRTIKDFRDLLGRNGFIPYVIFTEKRFNEIETISNWDLYETIKKMTSNYRKWNDIVEYINQCYDIMEEKIQNA